MPRVHRFSTPLPPEKLFRRLPRGSRFRFSPSRRSATVFGSDPVRVVRAERAGGARDPLSKRELREAIPRVSDAGRFPGFPGGAVGFVAYERGYPIEDLAPASRRPSERAPELQFGLYDTFARWEPGPREVEVVSWGLTADGEFDGDCALRRARALEERLRTGPDEASLPDHAISEPRASLARSDHARGVEAILDAIARGDVYQANLAVRFDVDWRGDGAGLFERLLRDNPAPYAAFLEFDEATIVSCSPERLLRARGRQVESRPIKGTAARDPDDAVDRELARALCESSKDQAELLMITDLLRNDLGKVCSYGSVHVPSLGCIESFPHVHHLVSTVRGRLRPDRDVFDAFEAVFPCGSITGAPKRRAMEILRDLEPVDRGVYTGAIGWIGFDRSAELAVAIRSGRIADGVFSFGAGGGIVADSRPSSEWEELQLKARAIRLALARERELSAIGGSVE